MHMHVITILQFPDYDAQASQRVAQRIRSSGGVVVAEELAPLLVRPPTEPRNIAVTTAASVPAAPAVTETVVDESFMLPVAIQFNGAPQVTPAGNIVYVFEVSGDNVICVYRIYAHLTEKSTCLTSCLQ